MGWRFAVTRCCQRDEDDAQTFCSAVVTARSPCGPAQPPGLQGDRGVRDSELRACCLVHSLTQSRTASRTRVCPRRAPSRAGERHAVPALCHHVAAPTGTRGAAWGRVGASRASRSPREGLSAVLIEDWLRACADGDRLARRPGSPLSESPVYKGETEARGPWSACPGAAQRVVSAPGVSPQCRGPGAGKRGGGWGQTLSAVGCGGRATSWVSAPAGPAHSPPPRRSRVHSMTVTELPLLVTRPGPSGHSRGTPQVSPPGRTSQPGTRGPSLLSRPLTGHWECLPRR